jgi:outer membrane lipoprotein LolB
MALRSCMVRLRFGAVALGCVLLTACVATRVPAVHLTSQVQRAALQALDSFAVQGRIAASRAGEGFNASLDWQQRAAASRVQLSGPLGFGALQLQLESGELTLTSRGETLRGEAAVAVVEQQLGFSPPLAALRFWILGVPAPHATIENEQVGVEGELVELSQLGWVLRFESYAQQRTHAGLARMPARLIATRDDLRLRLIVDRRNLLR